MGRRSNFERIPKDKYRTPLAALGPIMPYLAGIKTYVEPCAGDGRLIRWLEQRGIRCVWGCDIDPDATGIPIADARRVQLPKADMAFTNPPWTRALLHPIIQNLSRQMPTWLLFDAAWMFTDQAGAMLDHCSDIVAIPRQKWIPDTDDGAKDDCCWYLFDHRHTGGPKFHGRK